MVAQEHGHIGFLHNPPEDVHPQGAPIDNVPQDVQMVLVRKMDQIQHPLKFIQLAVYIRHTVDHHLHLLPERM